MTVNRNRKNRRRSHLNSIEYSLLEPRQLLAGITLETVNGFATVVVDGSSASDVSEVQDLNNGNIRVTLNAMEETFARSAVERIRFLGRSGNDSFTNNTDISSAAYGHDGDDYLRGGNGHNWIQGGTGNDIIFGGDRNDHLRGRNGDDFISPGMRHDRVFGGDGDDTVAGSQGDDFIAGENGNDTLRGGDGVDHIHGGNGADVVDGGDHGDELFGDNGNDEIYGRQGNDVIHGDSGNDTIFGNVGFDEIFGDNGNDFLEGNEGRDDLFGGLGNDTIAGGAGDDTIQSGSGNDIAVFINEFREYLVTSNANVLTIDSDAAVLGVDTATSSETIRFENVDWSASHFDVDLNVAELESLRLLNQLREQQGLSTLSAVADMSQYAEDWSRNELPVNFHHSSLEQIQHLFINGRTSYGENIVFIGSASLSPIQAATTFHEAWVDSPTHYENMTSSEWSEIGVGLVQLSSGWYGTHSFFNS